MEIFNNEILNTMYHNNTMFPNDEIEMDDISLSDPSSNDGLIKIEKEHIVSCVGYYRCDKISIFENTIEFISISNIFGMRQSLTSARIPRKSINSIYLGSGKSFLLSMISGLISLILIIVGLSIGSEETTLSGITLLIPSLLAFINCIRGHVELVDLTLVYNNGLHKISITLESTDAHIIMDALFPTY